MSLLDSSSLDVSGESLAARLRAAREEAGLTQAQAAAELGVSRPLLIAIEKGTRIASPAELVKLASIYTKSLSDLLRPSPPPVAIGTRFRAAMASIPDASPLEAGIQDLEGHADDYLDLLRRAKTGLPGTYPTVRNIDHLDPTKVAEDLAVEERNRLGLGDGPIQRLREVLELEAGLRVFIVPLPAKVAGLFVFFESLGGCVATNAGHPVERRRWTMAHEYAHFLATRSRPEVTPITHGRRVSETERFADAFAANFLMPRAGLARRFNELKRSGAGVVTPATLVQLAHLYCVSVNALTLRLEDLQLIPQGTWDKLRDHNFQPRSAAQDLGLKAPVHSAEMMPIHYRSVAAQLYADGEITEAQFARYLRTDIVGARRSYQDLTASRDVADDGSSQIVDLAGPEE
ncbi:XRE family transcriptional regulator [Asanoa siamensis]|nr:XRE family transcriptional regulator [Asanoa siamensis]